MGVSLDVSLYLAWLVPSTFSFLSSCAVIYYILHHKSNLKSQLFHQLTILLATADIIQSGCWFIGVKYSAHYHQCAVQEYLLQFGLALKACISVIICAVAIYVVKTQKTPKHRVVAQLTVLALLVPCTLIIGSLVTHSARLYCNVEIPKYSESSNTTQRAIMAYWVITLFIYICAALNVFLLSHMEIKLRTLRLNAIECTTASRPPTISSGSSISLPSQTVPRINNKMMNLITRLRIYPFIFVVLWIPEVISLVTILITGTDQLVLRHLANFFGGSIGLATTMSYFYYQEYTTSSSMTSSEHSASRVTSLSSSRSVSTSSSEQVSFMSRLRNLRFGRSASEQSNLPLNTSSSSSVEMESQLQPQQQPQQQPQPQQGEKMLQHQKKHGLSYEIEMV